MEVWKPITNFEGLYEVSNYGRIKSLGRTIRLRNNGYKIFPERILKTQLWKGYERTQLTKDGKSYTVKVHRVVAKEFIKNPNNLPQVNHKDENKTNNKADNLEWCTQSYNNNFGTKNQRMVETNKKKGNTKKCCEAMLRVTIKGVICITTGEKFDSISSAARLYGIDSSALAKTCKGRFKYCGKREVNGKIEKLKWKYQDNTEVIQ